MPRQPARESFSRVAVEGNRIINCEVRRGKLGGLTNMARVFLLALALVATHTLAEEPLHEGESLDWPEGSPGGTFIILARVPRTSSAHALCLGSRSRKLPPLV